MKRVLSVQDLSCVGKCSLGAALPVLSLMGSEACALPTAVLSNHTAFSHMAKADVMNSIPVLCRAWEAEEIRFDAISSGYLGSQTQISLVESLWERFGKRNCLRICDPAMGDAGTLYQGFDKVFVMRMRELCQRSDVILPNVTEACLLLDRPYREDFTEAELQKLVKDLAGETAGTVILTGYSRNGDRERLVGAASYSRRTGRFFAYTREQFPGNYYGTGDLFAAVITGSLMRGYDTETAVRLAVDFTAESIKKTLEDPNHRWYGTNFEEALPYLADRMRKFDSERKA